ncbi:MAG: hypothetical protein WCR71_02885 [Bacteroidales bacterium]
MKKLFLLLAVAGFVVTSCGSNAQKEEAVVEETEAAEVIETKDSTQVVEPTDSVPTIVEE